jgi:hypothetical protein
MVPICNGCHSGKVGCKGGKSVFRRCYSARTRTTLGAFVGKYQGCNARVSRSGFHVGVEKMLVSGARSGGVGIPVNP